MNSRVALALVLCVARSPPQLSPNALLKFLYVLACVPWFHWLLMHSFDPAFLLDFLCLHFFFATRTSCIVSVIPVFRSESRCKLLWCIEPVLLIVLHKKMNLSFFIGHFCVPLSDFFSHGPHGPNAVSCASVDLLAGWKVVLPSPPPLPGMVNWHLHDPRGELGAGQDQPATDQPAF